MPDRPAAAGLDQLAPGRSAASANHDPELGSAQKSRRRRLQWLGGLLILPIMLVSSSTWPDEGAFHGGIESLGLVLALLCVLGRLTCTLYIGGRKCSELITIGPYSLCRNPLYLSSMLGTVGVGFMLGMLSAAAFFGLIYLLVFSSLVRREERHLRLAFGSRYDEYCRQTPRWLPRPSRWRSVETLVVRPRLIFRTLRDASVFVLIFPVLEGIETLQQMHWLPVLLRLP